MRVDEAVDVRLVPAAAAAWGAAVVAVGASERTLWLATGAVTSTVVATVLVLAARRHRAGPAQHEGSGPGRAVGGQAVLVLGAVLVLLTTTAVQVRAREAGDLRALAAAGARVRLAGTVRSTPELLGGPGRTRPGDGGAVRFLLAARSVQVLTATDPDARAGAAVAPQAAGGTSGSGAAVVVDAPAGAADFAYGTSVEVEARLAPHPDRAARAVVRARAGAAPVVRGPPPAVLAAAAELRSGLVATAGAVPGDAGRLLPAVAVGDTRGVGDLDVAMRVSGLAHLTAVSGAHFSLVGALVLGVVARCGVPRRWRWLPVALVLGGFVAVVQPGSSVVRAAVMGAVGLLGIVAGRPARSVPALACAVLVLVVVDPWLAREIGFVLSVVATAGIALLAVPLARQWSGPPRARGTRGGARARGGAPGSGGAAGRGGASAPGGAGPVATALAVPVAAQAVCAPVVLVLSPALPTYAVLANVVVAPAVAPATVAGLLATVLGPWWPAGAAWCADVAGAACWWIAAVARTTAGLPGAQVAWAGGVVGQVLLAAACAAALVLVLRCRRSMAP